MFSKLAVLAAGLVIFGSMIFYGAHFARLMGNNVVRCSDYLDSPLK